MKRAWRFDPGQVAIHTKKAYFRLTSNLINESLMLINRVTGTIAPSLSILSKVVDLEQTLAKQENLSDWHLTDEEMDGLAAAINHINAAGDILKSLRAKRIDQSILMENILQDLFKESIKPNPVSTPETEIPFVTIIPTGLILDPELIRKAREEAEN